MNIFLKSAFALTFILVSFLNTSAQTFEGKVKFSIEYQNLPPEMEAMASMLPQEQTLFIKGDQTRMEQNLAMGSQVVLSNSKTKKGNLLMDMMGQKYNVVLSAEDYDKIEEEKRKPTIKYLKETKTIAGYKCKKAQITWEDGEEDSFVYYTDKIQSSAHQEFHGLKGFPLEYSSSQSGIEVVLTASEVSKEKVSSDMFKIPEGYTETTIEGLQQSLGGGGGY